MSLRLSDGNRVVSVRIPGRAGNIKSAWAGLTLVQDFSLLEERVRAMAQRAVHASAHPLRSDTFRPLQLLNAVALALDLAPTDWCCDEPLAQQAPITARPPAPELLAEHSVWKRHCTGCHDQPEPYPPQFLRGTPDEIAPRLKNCAPLILNRLNMWALPKHQRRASPMPPWQALRQADINPARWISHPDFKTMQRLAVALIETGAKAGTTARCE